MTVWYMYHVWCLCVYSIHLHQLFFCIVTFMFINSVYSIDILTQHSFISHHTLLILISIFCFRFHFRFHFFWIPKGIKKWMLFGGSWGSCLSLTYAVSTTRKEVTCHCFIYSLIYCLLIICWFGLFIYWYIRTYTSFTDLISIITKSINQTEYSSFLTHNQL